MAPKVSVILPVYNAGQYLAGAIESILQQTFRDFELIIIDDGSTDGSDHVIAGFTDPRILVITQANQGVRAALNAGLAKCQGEYVARMDHDDISDPRRLLAQVDFLDHHPDHVLVGTTYAYIDLGGQVTGVFPALLDAEDIARELFTKSPFGHGSVMMRGQVLRDHHLVYRATFTDDYDLWFQLRPYGKMANLPDILYFWRYVPGSITSKHHREQRQESHQLQNQALTPDIARHLASWPGWSRLQRYRNEQVQVHGRSWVIARRQATCSMYLNLAALMWRHRQLFLAMRCGFFALLISPPYCFRAIGRQLMPQPV